MKSRYYTFLYVPSDNDQLKTIRIKRSLVVAVALVLLFLAGAAFYFPYLYLPKLGEAYRMAALEKENAILKRKLEEFSRQVARLERRVRRNFDFQKKARLLANLDEVGDDVADVGVGGPEFAYARSLFILDKATKKRVELLGREIEKLMRQTELQKRSYQEIVASLSKEEARRSATPSIRPVAHGFVSSRFGRRMDPFTGKLARHRGVDYSVRLGTAIYAVADGVVTFAGRWSSFGNVVEISHGYGYTTRYAHVSRILVRKGQKVRRGDVIARVGSTGKSTAAHLHYEVLYNGVNKNPLAYILSDREVVD